MSYEDGYNFAFKLAQNRANSESPFPITSFTEIVGTFAAREIRSFEVRVLPSRGEEFCEGVKVFVEKLGREVRREERRLAKARETIQVFSFDLNAEDDFLEGR